MNYEGAYKTALATLGLLIKSNIYIYIHIYDYFQFFYALIAFDCNALNLTKITYHNPAEWTAALSTPSMTDSSPVVSIVWMPYLHRTLL